MRTAYYIQLEAEISRPCKNGDGNCLYNTEVESYVFVAYAKEDKIAAQSIVESLEAAGLPCWIAPRNVKPGESYAGTIVNAIRDCSAMVVVFSEHSNASGHVCNEVERAFNAKKRIIPFRISNTQPIADFEYFLSRAQWMDAFQGDPGAHVQRLIAFLRGTPPQAAPPQEANPQSGGVHYVPPPVGPAPPMRPPPRTDGMKPGVFLAIAGGIVFLLMIIGVVASMGGGSSSSYDPPVNGFEGSTSSDFGASTSSDGSTATTGADPGWTTGSGTESGTDGTMPSSTTGETTGEGGFGSP